MDPRLQPYLPRRLVGMLTGPAGARAVDLAGAVLFVDVSGFSALTQSLVETSGSTGLDRLFRVLESRFNTMAACVEAWGGEVVLFAGDAMVVWWPAPDTDSTSATLRLRTGPDLAGVVARAVGCSTSIHARLDAAGQTEGILLRVRQVVLAGELTAAKLGGAPHGWWPLLAGKCMDELGGLAGKTAVGRTSLSDGAARWWIGGTELLDGVKLVAEGTEHEPFDALAPALDIATTEDWLGPLYLRRAHAQHSPPQAELRTLTALLARLELGAGHTLSAQPVVASAQGIIEQFRGTLVSVFVDDKGLIIVAAFGLPGPDVFRPADPALAAVAIRAAIRDAGLSGGIGLATGTVVYADTPVGGGRRVALTGPALNLAARLMMLGDGVSCDSATARGAREETTVGPVQLLRLKGFGAAVAVREVMDRSQPTAPSIVGRESELDWAITRALQGEVAALLGVAGIGKTSLLREIALRLRARGYSVCFEPVPPELVGPKTVVVLDDTQWFDGPRAAAALRLALAQKPMVIAARPSETNDLAPLFRSALRLGALCQTDVALLASARFRAAIPDELSDWLWEQANGHPQFSIELLAVAQERGFLELDPAGRVLYLDGPALRMGGTPENMRAAMVSRLDLLDPKAMALLKAASAVGLDVPREALLVAAAGQFDESALDALVDDGWLIYDGEGSLHFANDSVRETVHGSLVSETLRELHGLLAAWMLENDPAQHRGEVLARHLAYAGRYSEAIAALDRAFDEAMKAGLGRQAGGFAAQALHAAHEATVRGAPVLSATERARWRWRIALACREYGETDQAANALEQALGDLGIGLPEIEVEWERDAGKNAVGHLWDRLLPFTVRPREESALHASILNFLALTWFLQSRPPVRWLAVALRAVRAGDRALTPAKSAFAASLIAIAMSPLGWAAKRYIGRALAHAQGDDHEELDAYLGRMILDVAHGRFDDADSVRSSVMERLDRHQNHSLHAAFLGLFACVDLLSGRYEACAQNAAKMRTLAQHEGYLQGRGWACSLDASLALRNGDPAAALALSAEAWTILSRRGDPDRLAAKALHARASLELGQIEAAIAEIVELEAMFDAESTMSPTGLETYATPAEIYLLTLRAGDFTRADAALTRLAKFCRQSPVARPRLATLRAFRAHLAGKDATSAFAAAITTAKRLNMQYECDRAAAIQAVAMLAPGSKLQASAK